MRMPWIALVASLVACKGEPYLPDAKIDAPVDAFQPRWLTPKPGELSNWDIQLDAPLDITAERDMYLLELWDVAPATTLTYADGSTLNIPAGPLAGMVPALKARAKLFCQVRAGSVRLEADPDAMKFPGYEASPPDNPTAPKDGSVIGWHPSSGYADERYLDVRPQSREVLRELVGKRIELADASGCDGVMMDRNDRYAIDPGWGLPEGADELSWHLETAEMAHDLGMAAGTKNSYLRGLLADLAAVYDFGVVARCAENNAEFQDCSMLRPYLNVFKPVYAYEHQFDGETGIEMANACRIHDENGILDGLVKAPGGALDATVTQPCKP